jgi:hypothetical protein
MTQLHIMDMWSPMEAGKLSREQRMRALSSLLFLKDKQTGDIKHPEGGRGVAYRINRINVHHCNDRSKRRKES